MDSFGACTSNKMAFLERNLVTVDSRYNRINFQALKLAVDVAAGPEVQGQPHLWLLPRDTSLHTDAPLQDFSKCCMTRRHSHISSHI